jgi:hypothetical protein
MPLESTIWSSDLNPTLEIPYHAIVRLDAVCQQTAKDIDIGTDKGMLMIY